MIACNDVMGLRSRRNKSRKRSVTHRVLQPIFQQPIGELLMQIGANVCK